MSKEYNEDVDIPEGLFAGNWIWGNIIVTPTANDITFIDITGLNVSGQGELFPQASVKSAYPWVSTGMVGISTLEGDVNPWDGDGTQIRLAFYRINDSETRIHWMVWRAPS